MNKREELTEMTFAEARKHHGEEAAINAGIEADPDTFELDAEWFAKAQPSGVVDPDSADKTS